MKKIIYTIIILSIFITKAKAQSLNGFTTVNPNVTDMGIATANIPIECNAGRNGMKPQISISYNHMAQSGVLGRNMTLNAISSISRGGSNYHMDNGIQQGIKHNNASDKFYLDGNKLILVSGTYGTNNSVYRTESDVFSRITMHVSGNNAWFLVELKDGGVSYYATQGWLANQTLAIGFFLDKTYDKYGNYIDYEYTGSDFRLDKILYNGFDPTLGGLRASSSAAISPDYEIAFTYTNTTTFENRLYTDGGYKVTNTLLTSIACKIDNAATTVRTYGFTYTDNGVFSQLTTLAETMNGLTRTPVYFGWDDNESNVRVAGRLPAKKEYFKTTGDFNGDGKSDLLMAYDELDPLNDKLLNSTTTFGIWCVNSSNQFDRYPIKSSNFPFSNISNISVVDFDADGADDILLQTAEIQMDLSNPSSPQASIIYRYHLLKSTLKQDVNGKVVFDKFVTMSSVYPSYTDNFGWSGSTLAGIFQKKYVTPYYADMDGDGLPDLLEKVLYTTSLFGDIYGCFSSNGYASRVNCPFPSNEKMLDLIPMDFNGNGKKDIYIHNTASYRLYEYNTQTGVFDNFGNGGSGPDKIFNIRAGDFNGDGNTDLFYFRQVGDVDPTYPGRVAFSDGKSQFNERVFNGTGMLQALWCFPMVIQIEVGDFNGDGKDDLLERHDHPSHAFFGSGVGPSNDYRIHYSLGYNTVTGAAFFSTNAIANRDLTTNPNEFASDLLGDFDGDGLKDVLLIEGILSFGLNRYVLEYHKAYAANLISISLLNKAYAFELKSLVNYKGYKKSLNPAVNNCVSLSLPIKVVSRFMVFEKSVLSQTYTYNYKDLMYNRHGRGVMGFLQVTTQVAVGETKNATTVKTYKQNNFYNYKLDLATLENYNHGTIADEVITPSVKVSDKEYEYKTVNTVTANKIITFSFLSKTTETDYLTKNVLKACFDYDLAGNLIHRNEVFYTLYNSDVQHTNASDYTYAQFDTWLPASITRIDNFKTRAGQPTINTPITFNYWPSTSMVKEKITLDNSSPQQLVEAYEYDIYGNTIKKGYNHQLNTSGLYLRNTFFIYDAAGHYLALTRNDAGDETFYQYDKTVEKVTKLKTPNGLETSYSYDAWGKPTGTLEPNGNSSTTNYVWSSGNVYLIVTETNNLGNKHIKYYNTKMQLVKEEKNYFYYEEAPDKMAVKDYTYNGYGLLTIESNWYNPAVTASKINTSYQYDIYNRLQEVKVNGTTVKTLAYNDNVTTITEGNKVAKAITTDAVGVNTNITEGASEITYTYNSNNLLRSVSANGNTITYEYDDNQMPTSECDPNKGCTTSEYNPFKELVKTTDSKGNQYQLEYDSEGRLTRKTGPNNTEYIYEYATKNAQADYNQIIKKTYKENSSIKHQIDYTYNSFGELYTTAELAANNNTYTTYYNYDTDKHRIAQIEYPNITLDYIYDPNNNLVQIKDDNTNQMVWQKLNEHADDRPATIKYGNDFITNYTYDANLKLAGITSQRTASSVTTTALNMTFSFNLQDGNLTRRSYVNYGHEELFHYDQFDRLTTIEVAPASVTSVLLPVAYSTTGNITQKYDAGLYEYHETRKHAVIANTYATGLSPVMVPTTMEEEQTFTYTPFNKVASLVQKTKTLNIEYGFGQERLKTTITDGSTTTTEIYYIATANMEIVNGTEISYISAEGQTFAYHNKTNSDFNYLHLDYQGSIQSITASDGTILEERNYDVWGRPRHPATLAYQLPNPFGSGSPIKRGYTFHEHLEEFNLVNMNGRMYDPLLARFLNADPLLQDVTNGQNYNRYSYVLNNPTKYTDPSGYAFVGAGAGTGGNSSSASHTGNYDGGDAQTALEAFKGEIASNISQDLKDELLGGSGLDNEEDGDPKVSNTKKSGVPKAAQDNLTPIDFSLTGPVIPQKISNYSPIYFPNNWEINPFNGKTTNINAGLGSPPITPLDVLFIGAPVMLNLAVKGVITLGARYTVRAASQGGLNLFKWGALQTGKSTGWKTGSYMLYLPNKGKPSLNWKANYGSLRREMNLGKPIFDSYRLPNGNLIPTGGFLNAERFTLQNRGWIYIPSQGAWFPPIR